MDYLPYRPSQEAEIHRLFETVFSASAGTSEGVQVGKVARDMMRDNGSGNIFGFVAVEDGRIAGSIFLTRLEFDCPVEAFILSPVAVDTDWQGHGVAQALIRFGIDQLRARGVKLVFTYGDPAFYSKVGFRHITEEIARAPFDLTQPEGWLCQSLDGREIEPVPGRARCVGALNNSALW